MSTESVIQQEIQMYAAQFQCNLMRNNSGALPDKDGRYVFYGLGNVSKSSGKLSKSSDLIGVLPMFFFNGRFYLCEAGQKYDPAILIGRFIAVECKKSNWCFNPKDEREQAQLNFINLMKSRGAIAGFCASVQDFKQLIGVV